MEGRQLESDCEGSWTLELGAAPASKQRAAALRKGARACLKGQRLELEGVHVPPVQHEDDRRGDQEVERCENPGGCQMLERATGQGVGRAKGRDTCRRGLLARASHQGSSARRDRTEHCDRHVAIPLDEGAHHLEVGISSRLPGCRQVRDRGSRDGHLHTPGNTATREITPLPTLYPENWHAPRSAGESTWMA